MKKEFTYPVPDELYLDTFTSNSHATWTYEGPEKLHVLVEDGGAVKFYSELPFSEEMSYDHEREVIEVVDASENPEVALYILNPQIELEFTTITNDDGSTHDEINNPKINNYYTLSYHSREKDKWKFTPITRSLDFPEEVEARQILEHINNYKQSHEVDSANEKMIDDYVESLETFLNLMKPRRPWRFESIKETVPKIPAQVAELVNLPVKE
jgi:hypothetical protein